MNKFVSDDKLISGQRDIDILSRADLRQEYALLTAKIELARKDPMALASVGETF